MRLIHCPVTLILGTLCLSSFMGEASGASPVIKDSSHLFSESATRQADAQIKEILRVYDKRLTIEIYATIPWYKRLLLSKDANAAIAELAKKSATGAGPNSIYVLICLEPAPARVEVAAGSKAQKQGFSTGDCERVRNQLLPLIQARDLDKGLLEAVRLVRETLELNLAGQAPPAQVFAWTPILSVILIMLGTWTCIELMQAFGARKRGTPEAVSGPLAYGGGGSYAAGLFATMNSRWLDDMLATIRAERRRIPAPTPLTGAAAVSEGESLNLESVERQDLGEIPGIGAGSFEDSDLDSHNVGRQG
jgi:hypothetical protein